MTFFEGIVLAILILYWCFFLGFMWWRVARHYRYKMTAAVVAMTRALWRSKEKRHRCQRIIIFYGFIVFLGISGTLLDVKLPWLLVPIVVTAVGTTISFLVIPPIALMLSSSEPTSARLAGQLQQSCAGFRVLFFQKAPSRGSVQAANLMQMQGAAGTPLWLSFSDNNHWIEEGEWKELVFEMMSLVPLLIVDLRSGSSSLDEEVRHILEMPALEQKTLCISNGRTSLKRLCSLQRSSSKLGIVSEAELGREILGRIRSSERKSRSDRFDRSRYRAAGRTVVMVIGSFFAVTIASTFYLFSRRTSTAQDVGTVSESLHQRGFTVTEILISSLMVFLIGVFVIVLSYAETRRSGYNSSEVLEQTQNMEDLSPLEKYLIASSDPSLRLGLIAIVGIIFCVVGVVGVTVAVLKTLL